MGKHNSTSRYWRHGKTYVKFCRSSRSEEYPYWPHSAHAPTGTSGLAPLINSQSVNATSENSTG